MSASPVKLLIVGDFNIHVDVLNNSSAKKFSALLDSFGLVQHVSDPTHDGGAGKIRHTLDLVITREADALLADCFVSDYITDHAAVHCAVKVVRPVLPSKLVQFRKLNSIDMAKFTHDISSLPFCCSPADNVDDLVHQYNNGLSSVLDCHAPLISRTVAVRPDNPWHTDEIRQAKCRLRKQEAKWRNTGLEIDRQMFRNLRNDANHMCDNAKVAFLNEKIAENTGKRSLFKLVDSFLLPTASLRLPRHNSTQTLVDRFGKYFME